LILSHALLALLLVGYPLWDRWEVRRVRAARSPEVKTRSFLRAIAGLWATALLVLLTTPARDLYRAPPIPASLQGALPPTLGGPAFMVPIAVGILLPVVLAAVHGPTRARFAKAFGAVAHLFPENNAQRALFAVVAISAGCCEELIYRGFLIRTFEAAPWGLTLGMSVAASSVVFGVAHAGQGWRGMLITGFMGLMFAALYLATGTLFAPILIHALIDLRLVAMSLFVRLEPSPPP
jgi:uncharacterized protein